MTSTTARPESELLFWGKWAAYYQYYLRKGSFVLLVFETQLFANGDVAVSSLSAGFHDEQFQFVKKETGVTE